MPTSSNSTVCYQIAADVPFRMSNVGIRAPRVPFVQIRRKCTEFVAYLVTDGEIFLTDEMPEGHEPLVVRAGEIHIIAPEIWQSNTIPFAPGIRFLWIHFTVDGNYTLLSQREAVGVARRHFAPSGLSIHESNEINRGVAPAGSAPGWLIPRHYVFGEELDWFVKLHARIMEVSNLKIGGERGLQLLGQSFLFELQRRYLMSFLESGIQGNSTPAREHVARAHVFVRLNIHRPLSTRHIASALGLNAAYLQRCFMKETGQTLGDFILAEKIEAARPLLRENTLSIKEIAHQCGFASSTYFGRIFQRFEGCSATEYRQLSARQAAKKGVLF